MYRSLRQRLREVSRPAPARRRSLRQILADLTIALVVTLAYLLAYFVICDSIRGRESDAVQHARAILALEGSLHVQLEPFAQQLGLSLPWLLQWANMFYLFGHLPVLITVAFWLYWAHPAAFAWFRNAFLCSALLGLSMYVILPVAPPRFLPGFIDTLKRSGVDLDGSVIGPLYDPYGAMPSLHVSWGVLDGAALLVCGRWWWLKVAGGLLPVLITLSVLITGNHYLLDAAAGLAVMLISLMLSACCPAWGMLARLRRGSGAARPAKPRLGAARHDVRRCDQVPRARERAGQETRREARSTAPAVIVRTDDQADNGPSTWLRILAYAGSPYLGLLPYPYCCLL